MMSATVPLERNSTAHCTPPEITVGPATPDDGNHEDTSERNIAGSAGDGEGRIHVSARLGVSGNLGLAVRLVVEERRAHRAALFQGEGRLAGDVNVAPAAGRRPSRCRRQRSSRTGADSAMDLQGECAAGAEDLRFDGADAAGEDA